MQGWYAPSRASPSVLTQFPDAQMSVEFTSKVAEVGMKDRITYVSSSCTCFCSFAHPIELVLKAMAQQKSAFDTPWVRVATKHAYIRGCTNLDELSSIRKAMISSIL